MSSPSLARKRAAPPETSRAAEMADAPSIVCRSPRTTFGLAILGCALLWLSFPPLGWWPLAWLAPLPWLWLCRQEMPLGRKGYGVLWLASLLFWAALLQGIRRAHPALYPGWLVLSAYLAVYLPLAVGMTRMLVHRWKWPLALAAPMVWVGLEYVRAYMVTGFSVAMLSQSQTPMPILLQTADVFGAYGPSFLMMLVAAAVTEWLPVQLLNLGYKPEAQAKESTSLPSLALQASVHASRNVSVDQTRGERIAWSLIAAGALIAALVYGSYRLGQTPAEGASAKVMLVQGSVDTVLDGNPERAREMFDHYYHLTFDNLDQHPACDLVVWPESAFPLPDYEVEQGAHVPQELDYETYRDWMSERLVRLSEQLNAREPDRTSLLVGGTTRKFLNAGGDQILNSALLVSPRGEISARYYKTHLVMFGEYIPFGEWLPIIYQMAPIQPISRGRQYQSFNVGGLAFCPNICFESTVPQLILGQTNTLTREGREPDVLINTTNDGWFYGTAILDLHFQCAVLRAIENRKPFLIAANTGISGVIDGNGRVLARGPRRATEILMADVRADGRTSPFRTLGDWPAAACFVVSAVAAVLGVRKTTSG